MEMNRMNYADVQRIILDYAPEKAAEFADRFSRFPCEAVSYQIADFLVMRAEIYKKFDSEAYQKIIWAADEIKRRTNI
jgi:hypothetical protein